MKRAFSQPGDTEQAFEIVLKSDGLRETKFLAEKYCESAVRDISAWKDSDAKNALLNLPDTIINRMK